MCPNTEPLVDMDTAGSTYTTHINIYVYLITSFSPDSNPVHNQVLLLQRGDYFGQKNSSLFQTFKSSRYETISTELNNTTIPD